MPRKPDPAEQAARLREEIRRHDNAYYGDDQPVVFGVLELESATLALANQIAKADLVVELRKELGKIAVRAQGGSVPARRGRVMSQELRSKAIKLLARRERSSVARTPSNSR